MKVNKPPIPFAGHLYLKYNGRNHNFYQKRSFSKIYILETDYNLKEELVVALTMFDGTETALLLTCEDKPNFSFSGNFEVNE